MTDAESDATLPTISDVLVQAADATAILTWAMDELADSFVDFGTISGRYFGTPRDIEDDERSRPTRRPVGCRMESSLPPRRLCRFGDAETGCPLYSDGRRQSPDQLDEAHPCMNLWAIV